MSRIQVCCLHGAFPVTCHLTAPARTTPVECKNGMMANVSAGSDTPYLYVYLSLCLSIICLSIYVYIYTYVYVYTRIYIYTHIIKNQYIHIHKYRYLYGIWDYTPPPQPLNSKRRTSQRLRSPGAMQRSRAEANWLAVPLGVAPLGLGGPSGR